MPPLEIELPSGLILQMWPRKAKYSMLGQLLHPAETKAELYRRFAAAIRIVNFQAIADLHDVRQEGNTTPPVVEKKVVKAPKLKVLPPLTLLPSQEQAKA